MFLILEKLNNLLNLSFAMYFWLSMTVLFLWIEIYFFGLLFFISLASGCFVASILALLAYSIELQCIAVLIVAIINFLLFKYTFASKNKNFESLQTNIYGLLNQKVLVVETISLEKSGYIKAKGDLWPAKTDRSEELKAGSFVSVIKIEGNNLIVRNQQGLEK